MSLVIADDLVLLWASECGNGRLGPGSAYLCRERVLWVHVRCGRRSVSQMSPRLPFDCEPFHLVVLFFLRRGFVPATFRGEGLAVARHEALIAATDGLTLDPTPKTPLILSDLVWALPGTEGRRSMLGSGSGVTSLCVSVEVNLRWYVARMEDLGVYLLSGLLLLIHQLFIRKVAQVTVLGFILLIFKGRGRRSPARLVCRHLVA